MQQNFSVSFSYPVVFTEGLFKQENLSFRNVIPKGEQDLAKVILVVDTGFVQCNPDVIKQAESYFSFHRDVFAFSGAICLVEGGENCKNDFRNVELILESINKAGICRHSYIVAIGGGAVLDMAGFAAAIAHRGIRLIRVPTTVLSQNDSGVGVKNSINFFGKKNFLGTFCPPYAVLNDFQFLSTLDDRDWRGGISEAIKVALIKDEKFYQFILENASALAKREMAPMKELVQRCACLHLNHISSGDPFETGSSRPLDFGHWAAHKLEFLTNYELRHGEAVAIGIAIDTTYSFLTGLISESEWLSIITLFKNLGFELFIPEMQIDRGNRLLAGIAEFREHLGGKLTIMLLTGIGTGKEVNYLNESVVIEAIEKLRVFEEEYSIANK